MGYFDYLVELADKFTDLIQDQAKWSQATFGTDDERGPVGALRHLAEEANEAADSPDDVEEYADCFLLILDASRRAGIKPMQLVEAAQAKLEICKHRKWSKPVPGEPVHHVKDGHDH